jgi:hypothetical protein
VYEFPPSLEGGAVSFASPYRQLLDDARRGTPGLPGPSTPALRSRLLAWLRQGALDRRVLDGVVGVRDERELRAREWQLTRPRARARIARALGALLAEGGESVARGGAAVPVRRAEVEIARDEIVRVVERLRDPRPVRPRGVVMLRWLLSDGNGPLYVASATDELWRRLRRAAIALD